MSIEGDVCGLLLAGGQSRRMGGGDKCLQMLGDKTLLARVIDCARPQVDELVLNANGDCNWVASFACDAPFAPNDLISRLSDAIEDQKGDLACASSNDRDQPVFGLWPVALAGDLRAALVDEDVRKVDVWTARYRLVRASWAVDPIDPFLNVNRPEDLARAEAIISSTS
jgi:molybdopterin-guanine dinucleotide biosynthesis protein A